MAKQVPLNSNTHLKTRIITARGADYGENVNLVPVVADELPNLVLDYPVCLVKNPDTGQFSLCAVLGFEPGENLFLEGDRWNACYVPANIRRQPFMVAFSGSQQNPDNAAVSVDMEHQRVQEEQGERVFNDDGTPTAFLNSISQLLSMLITGGETSKAFIEALSERDLIEPASLNVTFGGGEKKRIDGLYSINDRKLSELSEDDVWTMHKQGYLPACTLMITSMGQIQRLINLKNAKTAGGV